MNSSILFFKIPFWILAVVIRISCTENFTKDDNSSYSSLYDDSVYIEYNDTFDPNPECSVVPACQHSSSPWGDESLEGDVVPLAPIGCQTYVNCYEYSTFPPEIPDQASILTIQGSFFKNLSRSNLEELSSLVELMVEYNELRHIEPETFRNQAKLEVLRLHGNRLTRLDAGTFRGLSSLKLLDLSNNGITGLFSLLFVDLPNLLTLDLDLNSITFIGPSLFSSMSLLKSLSLKQNNITSLSKKAFQGLVQLKTLNLKQNRLKRIPALSGKYLPSLTSLYLSRNPISSVARNDFQGSTSLRHLWLHDCQIRNIEKLAFHGMALKTLVLEHNSLTKLPDLGTVKKLKTLKLNGNPWNCDSNCANMLSWLLRHNMKHLMIPCYKPIEKRGNNLLDFSIKELSRSTTRHTRNETNQHPDTNNSSRVQEISRTPILRNEFPRYKLYEGLHSGSDQEYSIIESTSEAIFSSEPFFILPAKLLRPGETIANSELSTKDRKYSDSFDRNKDKLTQPVQNQLKSTTAPSMEHRTTKTQADFDNKQIERKGDNTNKRNMFTISITTTVIIAAFLLAVTLTFAAKNIFKCFKNDKQYEAQLRKPRNKIKRRRSGKYDLTKARNQQVPATVYGSFQSQQ